MENQAPRNTNEIGILWQKTCRDGRTIWSGTINGVNVVGFTFTTYTGRQGMSVQVSQTRPTGHSSPLPREATG